MCFVGVPIGGVFRGKGGIVDDQQILSVAFLRRFGEIERAG